MLKIGHSIVSIGRRVGSLHRDAYPLIILVCLVGAPGLLPIRAEEPVVNQAVEPSRLTSALTAASESAYREDITQLEGNTRPFERKRLEIAAKAASEMRVTRIKQLVPRLAELAASPQSNPVLLEMIRLLATDGVAASLAWEEQRHVVISKRSENPSRDERVLMLPALTAARLRALVGDEVTARKDLKKILTLMPNWIEAIDVYQRLLYDSSLPEQSENRTSAATEDASELIELSRLRVRLNPHDTTARRILLAAYFQAGNVFSSKNSQGAIIDCPKYYRFALEEAESLLVSNPDRNESAKDLLTILYRLTEILLSLRWLDGNLDTALKHCERYISIAEETLAANPGSSEAVINVIRGRIQMSEILYAREGPGDTGEAYWLLEESLTDCEKLRPAAETSDESAMYMISILHRLGAHNLERPWPRSPNMAVRRLQQAVEIGNERVKLKNHDRRLNNFLLASLPLLEGALSRRNAVGDKARAIACGKQYRSFLEEQATSQPDSFESAADVWVSSWHLAALMEKSGEADAAKWWRRAYDVLNGLKESGGTLSEQDKSYLETLQEKLK